MPKKLQICDKFKFLTERSLKEKKIELTRWHSAQLSKELGLSSEHRKILFNRGLTDDQIEESLFFSIEQFQKVSEHYPLNLPGVYLWPQAWLA